MYGKLCTEFYDADKKFATQEEVDFYKSLFATSELLLEPMCGSGRLLIPLMQEDYQIHGVDNSQDMLESCRKRANKLGLKPILFKEEIENFKSTNQYDGIIIPFGSFQLFYPREKAFQMLEKFREFLKPNGKFVLDLFVPWDALWKDNEEENSQRKVQLEDGSVIKIDSHNIANKFEQFILSDSTYIKLVDGEVISQETEQMYVCWYYRYEIELILEKFGFKNIIFKERYLNGENQMTFIAERN